jgi:multidrug efflux pump subunit AcrB
MSFTNFIKRPVLSTVVSIFFVLLGIIGLVSLPIEQYPNIAPPTIEVHATYTGADAQTVLNSVCPSCTKTLVIKPETLGRTSTSWIPLMVAG